MMAALKFKCQAWPLGSSACIIDVPSGRSIVEDSSGSGRGSLQVPESLWPVGHCHAHPSELLHASRGSGRCGGGGVAATEPRRRLSPDPRRMEV